MPNEVGQARRPEWAAQPKCIRGVCFPLLQCIGVQGHSCGQKRASCAGQADTIGTAWGRQGCKVPEGMWQHTLSCQKAGLRQVRVRRGSRKPVEEANAETRGALGKNWHCHENRPRSLMV